MDPNRTIPIIVGVTGHRVLRDDDIPALRNAVKQELRKIQALCPNSRLALMSCLAEGADMLCADVATEMEISLYVALPMEAEVYSKDFPSAEKVRFQNHCKHAERVFVTPAIEPEPVEPNRNYLFRQADIYIVNHCHVLFALWDGGEPKLDGCGAAETVQFSLVGTYRPLSGITFRSASNEAVIHIFTPRGIHTEEPAGTVHVLGNEEAFKDIIIKTDHFNKMALAVQTRNRRLLPEDHEEHSDPILRHMEKIYRVSDDLSVEAAERYRRILKLLAVASTVITMAFLLYDEAEATWMILVCGAILFGSWVCHKYAVQTDCHNQYIEYRVLAEAIRVQAYLRYSGSALQVANILPWTQQEETAWIVDALCTINVGPNPQIKKKIKECWIDQQRDYHKDAYARTKKHNFYNERIVKIALFGSVFLYVCALLFELAYGGLLYEPIAVLDNVEMYRTILKIVLGTVSAATIFAANFYGKLSPQRKLSDHVKMQHFYEKMGKLIDKDNIGQNDELLTVLAREELIENGNWCSYQRDNTPDISL